MGLQQQIDIARRRDTLPVFSVRRNLAICFDTEGVVCNNVAIKIECVTFQRNAANLLRGKCGSQAVLFNL
ncbi:MAG: hypothetical protein RLZZ628_2986 [Bacteroidota bacterium]|jgi:hypothetical protein